MKVHAVVLNFLSRLFECKSCDFVSDSLTEVAQHVVANQFKV